MYATASDLLIRFGAEELAQRAAPEGTQITGEILEKAINDDSLSAYTQDEQDAAADAEARIEAALSDAELLVDSYLKRRHSLPLESEVITASPLTAVTCDITRYGLYDEHATEEIQKRFDDAVKWLRDVSAGKASLGAEDATAVGMGRVKRAEGESNYDWSAY